VASGLELGEVGFHQTHQQIRRETAGYMFECEVRRTAQRLRDGAHGHLGQSCVLPVLNDLAQCRDEAFDGLRRSSKSDTRPNDP